MAQVNGSDLYDCEWYWGNLEWRWAERLLLLCPSGTFLLRDSRSSTHLFSVSYNSEGKVYHSRVTLEDSRRILGTRRPYVSRDYRNLVEIIERSLQEAQNGQQEMLHYRRGQESEAARVHLTRPLTKRELMPSLQYRCRFVIRKQIPASRIPELLAAPTIIKYLEQRAWIIPDLEECEKRLKSRAEQS